jgi:cytidylate kinase
MLITISGVPGSGKTTVAKLLAARLALPHVYAGDLYRQEAKRRGLSLEQFNHLCERDHSIDRTLDAQMAERAEPEDRGAPAAPHSDRPHPAASKKKKRKRRS